MHMRVVEPEKMHHQLNKKKRTKKGVYISLLILIVIGGVGTYAVLFKQNHKGVDSSSKISENTSTVATSTPTVASETDEKVDTVKDTLVTFSDNEFRIFYNNLRQPNLEPVSNPPTISGNDVADARIREIAERRGYRLRSSPIESLVSVDGQRLQAPAVDAWKKLKSAATTAGHPLSLVSGYRSVADQRALFLQRLSAAGGSIEAVANGTADSIVDSVLVTSSIPGYSKHHTGYTIDLQCSGYVFENFKNSPCNDWMSADNYKVAKELGFIPSYPPQADMQGPDPEAWEYVYVGTDLLYE